MLSCRDATSSGVRAMATSPPPDSPPPPAPPPPAGRRRYLRLLIQSAGQLLAGFLVSLECAYFFGATRAKDAFDVAYLIPEALLSAAGFSLMQNVATAAFARLAERRDADASEVFSTLVNLLLASGVTLTLLGALLARPLVGLVAPGLGPDGIERAVTQLYLLLPLTLLLGMSMFLGAVQTAYGFAGASELGWLLLRTVVVVGLLLVPRSLGITGLSLCYVGGGALALAVQIRLLRRTGLRYRLTVSLRSPHIRTILRQVAGFAVSSVITQIALLQMRNLASRGPAGSIAALGYAMSLTGLAYQFVAKPLMLIEGPRLIRRREVEGPAAATSLQRRVILAALGLTVPVVAVLILGREPLVRLLFERGVFDHVATARTAGFLAILCLSAFGDTLVAVTVLPALAQSRGWGVPGAYTASYLVQIAFMTLAFPALGVGAVPWGMVLGSVVRAALVHLAGRGP
jgi:putative peptidoglycan lipid II flippase